MIFLARQQTSSNLIRLNHIFLMNHIKNLSSKSDSQAQSFTRLSKPCIFQVLSITFLVMLIYFLPFLILKFLLLLLYQWNLDGLYILFTFWKLDGLNSFLYLLIICLNYYFGITLFINDFEYINIG